MFTNRKLITISALAFLLVVSFVAANEGLFSTLNMEIGSISLPDCGDDQMLLKGANEWGCMDITEFSSTCDVSGSSSGGVIEEGEFSITNPSPGSTISDNPVTIEWESIEDANYYYINVGYDQNEVGSGGEEHHGVIAHKNEIDGTNYDVNPVPSFDDLTVTDSVSQKHVTIGDLFSGLEAECYKFWVNSTESGSEGRFLYWGNDDYRCGDNEKWVKRSALDEANAELPEHKFKFFVKSWTGHIYAKVWAKKGDNDWAPSDLVAYDVNGTQWSSQYIIDYTG